MNDQCPICKSEVPAYSWNQAEPGARIKCDLCGEYRLSERLAQEIYTASLRNLFFKDSYIYSGAIRENFEQGIILWVEDFRQLTDTVVVPKNPLESIDKVLLYILRKADSADEGVELKQSDRSLAYAKTPDEFSFFLKKARELNYLEKHPNDKSRDRLAIPGWQRVAQLPQNPRSTSQAFVAMWFNKELEDVWEDGFKSALAETGYTPIRIDRTEHNEKVDDRIIAEIRKSSLLVADFTGQRGGVYFEAGFAMGLGTPIIWTCRDTDIDSLHFDTRQYNHIVWATAADLKDKLVNRIEATLPNRPRRTAVET
jgi:nucleoside 2-deoxyribosyltransferase